MSSPSPIAASTPEAPARSPGDNAPVNVLRILAAIAVVLEHARTLLFVDYDNAPHNVVTQALYGVSAIGHQAVVVFFVLSGYWVGGTALRQYRRNRVNWRLYISDRVTRLWVVLIPALVLTLVLDLVGQHFFGGYSTYRGDPRYGGVAIAHHPLNALTFLGNTAFLGGIRVEVLGSNAALWSLGYEFWMYLLGPMLVLAVLMRRRTSLLLLAVAVAVAVLVGLPVLAYLPIWLLGMAVAAAELHLTALWVRLGTPGTVAIRCVAGIATLGTAVVVRGMNSLPTFLGDYMVAVPTGVLVASLVQGLLSPRPRRFVNRFADLAASSYSLYAIHVPVLILFASLIDVQVETRWQPDVAHWLMLGLVVTGCVALGWLFAQVTERHTHRVRARVRRAIAPNHQLTTS